MRAVSAFLLMAWLFCLAGVGQAVADTAAVTHALAMHGAPKYGQDFSHLDYVNPHAPKGGTLRLAKTGTFDNLNNHIITGNNAEGLEFVNDKLMQRVWDEPFTLYASVAEKVEVAPDRSQIVYHLNPAARFHDGVPMTAEDVQFSYETYRNHGHPVRRRVYGLVTEVKIIDPHTILFRFGPGFDRESVMILSLMSVLPKHYWEKNDVTRTTLTPPVGSGPYKIAAVDPGRKIVYEKVRDWWARDLPVNRGLYNFNTITYSYFRDDDVSLQSFKAGEYDLRREHDAAQWETAYDTARVQDGRIVRDEIAHGRPEWLRALVFNTRRPLFADRRVRQALGLMFNADWLNRTLYHGKMQVIDSAFANSELAAQGAPSAAEHELLAPYKEHLPAEVLGPAYAPPSGDMRDRQRQAMALLKEAGWEYRQQKLVDAQGQPFRFELLLGSVAEEKMALEFSRSLARLGIEARVRTVDNAQFAGRLESFDYDMVAFRWINSLSPGNEQMNYWGSAAASMRGSRNYAGVRSPAIDALADSIARTEDREGLVTRCRALDRALMHGHYLIPLFYLGRDLVAHGADIKRPASTPVYGVVLESWWRDSGDKKN